MNYLPYYLGFSHFTGIGPTKFNKLVQHFGDVRSAYWGSSRVLRRLISEKTVDKFVRFRHEFNPFGRLEELARKGMTIFSKNSRGYPRQLLDLEDSPICLYILGDPRHLNFSEKRFFSIVGTRRPSPYGSSVARKFANELGSLGFVIVSGMALGIDSEAHRGALDAGAKTIAFLGCGADIIYPKENEDLYYQIVDKGGLVISEFPPGMTVKPGLFIARNRLISGLSKGVLVIEGGKDSGALITARIAGEQGKEVFAVPSPINSVLSDAPNRLIQTGAKLVSSVDDILQELNLNTQNIKKEKALPNLNSDELRLYQLLQKETFTADQISEYLNISLSSCMQLLTNMELKNIIEKNIEGKYQLRE